MMLKTSDAIEYQAGEAANRFRIEPEHLQITPDLRAGKPLDAATFRALRRQAVLDGCKWDPQVGDVETLASFPLVMKSCAWRRIASQAEQLAEEAAAAEQEVPRRPELLGSLGLPCSLRRVLVNDVPLTPGAGRVMRFDFHHTTDGWRISEANSDVPGGFSEASDFTIRIAEHYPGLRLAGDPAAKWVGALAAVAGDGGVIALLSAPGYMEDQEVVAYLASQLRRYGCRPHIAKPEQIIWRDGFAQLDAIWHRGPVDVIVKFYQAEWMARLPRKCGWQNFFRGGRTRVANPPASVISESKRFPVLWDRITAQLPTWRALLPDTRDPRDVPWQKDDGWLVKSAMCNNGDTVGIREMMLPADWLRMRMAVRFQPQNWIAQRRFESVPVATPAGPRHVCVGVYTVNGRAAGAYARMSEKPVIDFAAVDVALLLEGDD